MRLRQIALVARDLDRVSAQLADVLGLGEPFADPGVSIFGLRNAVFPVGDTFLEVVSPDKPGTSAGRFLERRGGDGGYMVIVQSEDRAADRRRVDDLGIRVVWEAELPDISTIHLHPRDVGGAILSLDVAVPPESWRWAGPDWRRRSRSDVTSALVAVEMRAADPRAMAARWSAVLGRAADERAGGDFAIALDAGCIRFTPERDGAAPGLAAFDVAVADRDRVLATAERRGLLAASGRVEICGAEIRPVAS
jgi:hypothetical protein